MIHAHLGSSSYVGARIASPLVSLLRPASPPPTHPHPQPTTTAPCPTAAPTSTLVSSFPAKALRRSREGGNPRIPAPRRRWEMERNGTKRNRIKSSPLLATPDEAHQGHNEVTVAPCLRVNGEQRGHAGLVSCLAARSESGQIGPNRPTVWGVSTPDHS